MQAYSRVIGKTKSAFGISAGVSLGALWLITNFWVEITGFLIDSLLCFIRRDDVAISFRGDPPVEDGINLEAFVVADSFVGDFWGFIAVKGTLIASLCYGDAICPL